jgi:hypothetical protein
MDIRFEHPHFRLFDYDTNNRKKNTAIPSLQIPMENEVDPTKIIHGNYEKRIPKLTSHITNSLPDIR